MNTNGRWSRRRMLVGLATVAAVAIAAVASFGTASGHAQSGEDVDWPTVNGTLDGQRYSLLTQIDTSNVKGLKVAWQFRAKRLGAESYPVVVGGTAYVTTTYGNLSTPPRASSCGRSTAVSSRTARSAGRPVPPCTASR